MTFQTGSQTNRKRKATDSVAVVIPTLNAQKHLEELLPSLKRQTLVPSEILIVDSESEDQTEKVAKSFGARFVSIRRRDFNHGLTRTFAAKLTESDIVVFMTQDALPANEKALENLVLPLIEHDDVAASYGRQIPRKNAGPFESFSRLFNYPERDEKKTLKDAKKLGFKVAFMSNSFAAYKRQPLKEVGYFPETHFGEDSAVAAKLLLKGYAIYYSASAVVYHSHSYGIADEFRRYFDVGAFHSRFSWLIESFGSPVGEGKKFVKQELFYLLSERKYHLLIPWFFRNAARYLGYKMGLNFGKIPSKLLPKLSAQPYYWRRKS